MQEVSEGKLDYAWPAQVNKLLRDGGHDLILSLGQVVPHEVVGLPTTTRIFLSARVACWASIAATSCAVYGMERMMGRRTRRCGAC